MTRITREEEILMQLIEELALRYKTMFMNSMTDVELYHSISDYFHELELFSEQSTGDR